MAPIKALLPQIGKNAADGVEIGLLLPTSRVNALVELSRRRHAERRSDPPWPDRPCVAR